MFRNIILHALWCMVGLLTISCGDSKPNYGACIQIEMDNALDSLEKAKAYVEQFNHNQNADNLKKLIGVANGLHLEYDDGGLTLEEQQTLLSYKSQVDSMHRLVTSLIETSAHEIPIPVFVMEDQLMDKTLKKSFFASRGDTLLLDMKFDNRSNVCLYNADSHKLIRSWSKKKQLQDKIAITNSAIYLLLIDHTINQYVDAEALLKMKNLDLIVNPHEIQEDTVKAKRSDWQSFGVDGINMCSLFEEPRKLTLRGQLKAAFSGSARAVVAIQVPKGVTDVMYSLRISTNEGKRSEDGKFFSNMSTSYRKIKFLGLPLYESQKGIGLLETLLGENQPPREEDAYVNMYVFFNAAQARKFQNGAPANELKYSLDYSTLGTQSCNGRIPAKGKTTIYLAFENERVRYNNYLWLEAITSLPKTDYYKIKYSIINKQDYYAN